MSEAADVTAQDELEIAIEQGLAASALGPLSQRVEGSAQIIVDHPAIRKLTLLESKSAALAYAKVGYNERLLQAVEQQDEKGFIFPDFENNLIALDFQLRTSIKERTRKIIESMTKIFQHEGGSRTGFFGWGRK